MEQLSRGDFSARVSVDSEDEIGAVALAFNEMADNLQEAQHRRVELEEGRKQFTAAISHDLRTPLASARAMLEAIQDGVVVDSTGRREYLARSIGEIKNLSDLVNDLFELSLLDVGALKLDMQPTPLQELVLDTVAGMSAATSANRKAVRVEVDESIGEIIVDGLRVRRVLMNLVQNAIRHTPADGSITVHATDEGTEVKVEVIDNGDGISPEDLPRIWTRFFKSDPSRTKDSSGLAQSGLGLATAKAIVELHGGWIAATSKKGQGSVFTFALPKRTDANIQPQT